MRPSQALYSALAPSYREHFEVPRRRAYDALAWERVLRMLPERGPVIDAGYGPGFTLIEGSMETADLPQEAAGMVLALGSLQYTADPAATLRRLAGWVRPGGTVVVLVDSLVALVIELLRDGRAGEAVERLRTRVGCWAVAGHCAEMHLLDACRLRQAFKDAGLRDVEVVGLLSTAAPLGRELLS